MKHQRWLWIFFLGVCLSQQACITYNKLIYLKDEQFSDTQAVMMEADRITYLLQTDDILNIQIKDLNGEIPKEFAIQAPNLGMAAFTDMGLFVSSYSIDKEGFITLPTIGAIQVVGKTTTEVERQLQPLIAQYLIKPTVAVKLVSFKVSVMGEVRRPGRFTINHTQLTLLEALALAGDLNPLADRERLHLIRQKEKGNEVILLNLTKGDVLRSPYFYLQPNDVLIVQPMKAQARRSNLPIFTTIFAGISSIALLANFLFR